MKINKFSKLIVGLLLLNVFSGCSVENNNKPSNSFESTISTSIPSLDSTSSQNKPVDKNSSSNNNGNVDNNPLNVQIFINNMENIDLENITLDHKDILNGAYFIYSTLSVDNQSLSAVIAAKAKLDTAKELFINLYEEFLVTKEAEDTGYAFAELVADVENLDALVREDIDIINDYLKVYDLLSEEAKALTIVVEAKTKLDAAKTKVEGLIAMSDDEYAIIQFVASVNKLPSVEELTIFDVEQVNLIVAAYNNLSNENKLNQNVVDAKVKLDALSVKANKLEQIQKNADAFIEMVFALPTSGLLEWQNATQDNLIKAAENAYTALSEEEKAVDGVSEAYAELQNIRNYFDSLKQPYDVSKLGFSWNLGPADSQNNRPTSYLSFNGNPLNVLSVAYNIPLNEINQHLKIKFNIYREAGAVATDPLYSYDITNDYTNVTFSRIVETLKELQAAGNSRVAPGQGYCYTINIESLSDLYASSKYSNFFGGQYYTWTNSN